MHPRWKGDDVRSTVVLGCQGSLVAPQERPGFGYVRHGNQIRDASNHPIPVTVFTPNGDPCNAFKSSALVLDPPSAGSGCEMEPARDGLKPQCKHDRKSFQKLPKAPQAPQAPQAPTSFPVRSILVDALGLTARPEPAQPATSIHQSPIDAISSENPQTLNSPSSTLSLDKSHIGSWSLPFGSPSNSPFPISRTVQIPDPR
ncbi:MAG: hypothetical protein Q9214_001840 [Letrouitia sp. 1 TL-2023]